MAVYLTESDIASVLDMPSAIAAVEDSMRQVADGAASVILRRRAALPHGMFHLMGGACELTGPKGSHVHGLKAYTSTPGGARFSILVFGGDGKLEGFLEGDTLGKIRTGAASAVATKYMARSGSKTLLLIGSGSQARTQALGIKHVLELDRILVWSPSREHRETFARRLQVEDGLKAEACGGVREALSEADVVTTITTARQPAFQAQWVREGTHINACGSNSLDRIEIDPALFGRAGFICADNVEQARTESGDIHAAVAQGIVTWEAVHALPGVVSGEVAARAADSDITVFESHGLGVWDVACGALALRRARAMGIGRTIEPELGG